MNYTQMYDYLKNNDNTKNLEHNVDISANLIPRDNIYSIYHYHCDVLGVIDCTQKEIDFILKKFSNAPFEYFVFSKRR